jgi:hypothetical protein
MSKIKLTSINFINSITKSVTHGFVIEDEYDKTYDDNSECEFVDNLDLLGYVVQCCKANKMDDYDTILTSILDHLLDNKIGLTINETFYDFNEVASILETINIFPNVVSSTIFPTYRSNCHEL